MADEPKKPVELIPSVANGISGIASADAPFIYFEGAPFCGLVGGICKIVLSTSRQIATDTDGTVLMDRVLVAHLIGNMEALLSLRGAIDKVLLMAQPKPEGPAN